jgi:hypothetical protein
MPSRRTSPSYSSSSLPTNADRPILGLAIVAAPPCRPSPARENSRKDVRSSRVRLIEFPPRPGTLTRISRAQRSEPAKAPPLDTSANASLTGTIRDASPRCHRKHPKSSERETPETE